MDLQKVKVVLNWDRLTTITEVESFHDLADRRCIEAFLKKAGPLHRLTRKC